MVEALYSGHALAVILESGAFMAFIFVGLCSFYVDQGRRLIKAKLTYDDADKQMVVRGAWIAGWVMCFAAALLLAHLHGMSEHEVSVRWYLLYLLISVMWQWTLAKVITFICILLERIWSYVFRGKSSWR